MKKTFDRRSNGQGQGQAQVRSRAVEERQGKSIRIANLPGVQREGVSETAGKLQAGSINYSRGKITVLDRPKLEARVCECYAVV